MPSASPPPLVHPQVLQPHPLSIHPHPPTYVNKQIRYTISLTSCAVKTLCSEADLFWNFQSWPCGPPRRGCRNAKGR
eukprot:762421-Hanusia_phi.AAC.3